MKIWQLILVYLNQDIRARCHTCVFSNTKYTKKMVIQKQLRKYGDGNIIVFAQLSKVFTSNSITQLLKSLDSPFSHSSWTFLVKISIFRLRGCLIGFQQVIFILGNREQGTGNTEGLGNGKDWGTHKQQSNPVPSPYKGRVRVG